MARYDGEIKLFSDGPNNPDAIAALVSYVERTIDYGHFNGSENEKAELKASIKIAIKKLDLPPVPRMTMAEFNIECLIGYGSYGRIWKAESGKLGPVALKQISVEYQDLTDLWKERDLMILLKHERICNLLAAFYDRDVFFVMELCHGSVAYLRNRISPKNAVRFAVQILQGLEWIHSKNVVHADIKPDNCLITTSNNVVISDFGSAFYLENTNSIKTVVSHGSPGYLDYAANKNLTFTFGTDVFSAACVIFEMDTKHYLLCYQDRNDSREIYVDAFENGRIIGLCPNDCPTADMERENLSSRAMKSRFGFLIKKMIVEQNRLSASEALQDPTLRLVLSDSGVDVDNLNDDTHYVTREFNVDHSFSFDFYRQVHSPEIELALVTFAFDGLAWPETTEKSPDDNEEPLFVPYKSKKQKVATRKRRHNE